MKEFLKYKLIDTSDYILKVSNLLGLLILILCTVLIIFLVKRVIYKSHKIFVPKKYALYQLFKYFFIVVSVVLSFKIIGFDISLLLAGSAALLVGVGLGIQHIFSDFISGIVILIEGTIKVDDIIDISGIICKVQDINFRTTKVLTRDDKYIIVPNSELTKNHIINWTHSKIISRFDISFGVDYSSDIHLVIDILEKEALDHPFVLKEPKPFARFNDCGNSSLLFTIYFWAKEVFRVENIKSDLRIKIFEDFKRNGIQIPFPQRVVHLKENQ